MYTDVPGPTSRTRTFYHAHATALLAKHPCVRTKSDNLRNRHGANARKSTVMTYSNCYGTAMPT